MPAPIFTDKPSIVRRVIEVLEARREASTVSDRGPANVPRDDYISSLVVGYVDNVDLSAQSTAPFAPPFAGALALDVTNKKLYIATEAADSVTYTWVEVT